MPSASLFRGRKPRSRRVPMHFRLRSGAPFSFAGIRERRRDARGNEIRTFAIVTTEANDLMRPFHPRMPAMLRSEDEALWLNAAFGAAHAPLFWRPTRQRRWKPGTSPLRSTPRPMTPRP
ncbi:MAG: SOS response-associated peptidase family protein [Elusimicrobia bacterium]|nr:SOS response-associated peptidase family protein [Elusimicrobiota bacterium]